MAHRSGGDEAKRGKSMNESQNESEFKCSISSGINLSEPVFTDHPPQVVVQFMVVFQRVQEKYNSWPLTSALQSVPFGKLVTHAFIRKFEMPE